MEVLEKTVANFKSLLVEYLKDYVEGAAKNKVNLEKEWLRTLESENAWGDVVHFHLVKMMLGNNFGQAALVVSTRLSSRIHQMDCLSGALSVRTVFRASGEENAVHARPLTEFLERHKQAQARALFVYTNNNHFDMWWPKVIDLNQLASALARQQLQLKRTKTK